MNIRNEIKAAEPHHGWPEPHAHCGSAPAGSGEAFGMNRAIGKHVNDKMPSTSRSFARDMKQL